MALNNIIDDAEKIFNKVEEIVKKYIPDQTTRDNIFNDLDISHTKAQFELDKLQVQMNMNAAQSPRWRDILAYTCVAAIGYHVMVHPIVMQFFLLIGHPIQVYTFNMSDLNQLVFALLGLAGFETAHSGIKLFANKIGVTNDNSNTDNAK